MRERLLQYNDLTLQKAVDLIKAAEQTEHQVKLMGASANINALKQGRSKSNRPTITSRVANNKQQKQSSRGTCGRCGTSHAKKKRPAFGQKCHRCGNMNHYQSLCRSKTVASVKVDDGIDQYEISTVGEQPSRAYKALVNLYINRRQPGNEIRFQVDTGSKCDLHVLPLKVYKSVTGDNNVERLKKCNKSIVSYTGERKQIAGKTSLPVWHKDRKKSLTFNVVNDDYQPILSLNTSIMLGIVTLADCDVLSLEGLGELPGEYKITTDESVKPKVHPPRRVPVAVRPRIKEKLEELVQRNVITPVTEPTEWVSSMLAVIKPNKIRIFIDPRDLNEAIKREHYQMPTIEEIATRLDKAKLFTVVDARDRFRQKKLDRESSYKTTFNIPFGRYRWLRMPFGISSAPEVWQRTMHELVEGLQGVEVIADDFIIAGFGNTTEEAYQSLECNKRAFFTKCREWNLKLNKAKVKHAQTNVQFMGHQLT